MGIKKEYRCTPTFVNLKSNTMKKNHMTNIGAHPIPSKYLLVFDIPFYNSFTDIHCFRTRTVFLR